MSSMATSAAAAARIGHAVHHAGLSLRFHVSPAPTVPDRHRCLSRRARESGRRGATLHAHERRVPEWSPSRRRGARGLSPGAPAAGPAPFPASSPINLVTEVDRGAEALVVGDHPRAVPGPLDPGRGRRRPASLRPPIAGSSTPRWDHQLRPWPATLLRLDRAGSRRPRRCGRGLRPNLDECAVAERGGGAFPRIGVWPSRPPRASGRASSPPASLRYARHRGQ